MKVMGANILSHNAKNLVADAEAAQLAKLPPAAIRWVMQDDRVSMLNIGASMPADFDKNIATLSGDLKFTNEDRMLLAKFSSKAYEAEMIKQMKVT
jgi:predicted aldo/keto reductase-like oxidoreductase